jgi:hypothetical protein
MGSPSILFLCSQDDLQRTRQWFYEALQKRAKATCLDSTPSEMSEISILRNNKVDLVLYPDVYRSYLPTGVENIDVPTTCLHIDTYNAPHSRFLTSLLFDVSIVCHPGFARMFEERGHPEVLTFPLAVRKQYYDDPVPTKELDVAMVGRLHGKQYSYRRSCVEAVRNAFEMNDVEQDYDYSALSALYLSARIGLNVSRDDHLQDANLRCFEVMAGGALLMTPKPSELTDLGLREGEHFVGFRNKKQLLDRISYYLEHDEEREEIALRGRDQTLDRFTYDHWAKRLIDRIEQGVSLQAPARSMSSSRVAGIYVDYFSKRGKLNEALNHLRRQRQEGGYDRYFLQSAWKAAKATMRRWQRALLNT